MMERLLADVKEAGYETLVLWVLEKNTSAIRLRFAVQLQKVAIAEPLIKKVTIHRSGRFKLGTFCKDLCGDDLPEGGLPALCLHVGEALFIAGTNTSDALH